MKNLINVAQFIVEMFKKPIRFYFKSYTKLYEQMGEGVKYMNYRI